MHIHPLCLVVVLAAAGAYACSASPADSPGSTRGHAVDSGQGSADGAPTRGDPTGDAGAGAGAAVSFEKDIFPIFQMSCATGGVSCHGDPSVVTNGPGGNREYLGPAAGTVAAATILAGLVGVASVEDPSLDVVKAGSPDLSYLMNKMDDTLMGLHCSGPVGCGLLMPFGAATLPQATRDVVRTWIAQGARSDMQVAQGSQSAIDSGIEAASLSANPDATTEDSGAQAPPSPPSVSGVPKIFDAGGPISSDAGPLAGQCTQEGTCNAKPWYACQGAYTTDAAVTASYFLYAGVAYGCTLDQIRAAACTSGSAGAVDCCLTLSAAAFGKALVALGCTP